MTRAIVLAEGQLGTDLGKTANGLVLHSVQDDIVAVIDSTRAGADAGMVVAGRPAGIPVVRDLHEALTHRPERLYLGVANIGGVLPETFRGVIRNALKAGLTVINGLHAFLDDDPEFAALVASGHGAVADVRRPPDRLHVAQGAIFDLDVPRVLVMGMDCDIGKRITVVELLRMAHARGVPAGFVATGQTGCMLGADAGCVIDRVPADFVAGQTEHMILETAANGRSPIFIYGQSSILHPGYSGVALGILHGSQPHAVILQIAPGRRQRALFDHPALTMGDVLDEIALIERLGATRVVGLAVNPSHLAPGDVRAAMDDLEAATGLPAVDPLTGNVDVLLDAIDAHLATHDTFVRRPQLGRAPHGMAPPARLMAPPRPTADA